MNDKKSFVNSGARAKLVDNGESELQEIILNMYTGNRIKYDDYGDDDTEIKQNKTEPQTTLYTLSTLYNPLSI